MYNSGLDRHRRVAVEQRIRVETRRSDMITNLRVGVPWWQMRVPIRVGFPASCGDLLDVWVERIAGIEAASYLRGVTYRRVRTLDLLGSVHCRRGTRRQRSVELRERRSPRTLLLGTRAAIGVGLVPAAFLPLERDPFECKQLTGSSEDQKERTGTSTQRCARSRLTHVGHGRAAAHSA